MTSMIERVARGMAWADLHAEDREKAIADGLSQDSIVVDEHLRKLARAAIEAMREPTDELHAAAEEISVYYDDFSCGDGNITLGLPGYRAKFDGVWSSLIDAALKES